ncbi:hypothetical protein [Streptomyces phytophilus]|uniref:hypothetical protein n=1 Tax=Streptomyces phytophilus TaxID=722715 RepID=UPI0015F016E7|nr:hypothetical protein [Streptomyces phytophilus]
MVGALCRFRVRDPFPPGVGEFLVPQADAETLSDLGYRIEVFLADGEVGEVGEAAALALAAAGWLGESLGGPVAGPTGLA